MTIFLYCIQKLRLFHKVWKYDLFSLYIVLFFQLHCFVLVQAWIQSGTHGITYVISLKKNKSVALVRETRRSSVGLIWILCSLCELAHLISFLILYTEDWQGWQCFLVNFFKETTTKSRKLGCNCLSECSWKLCTWSLMWYCKVSWLRLCS